MGQRGPLPKPTSIRSERARKKARTKATAPPVPSEGLKMPDWLPATAEPTWCAVLRDLIAADVPLMAIDAHAIAMYVSLIMATKQAAAAQDSKLLARLNRDAIAWANQIGATPAARARLGLKPPPEVDEETAKWAAL